jgi:hypothetical protein
MIFKLIIMKRRITIKSLLSALICMTLTTGVFGQSFGSGNYTLKTNLGVTLPALTNATLAWGDYNNDGNLDLLVSGVNSGNQLLNVLYKNNGNSTFTEVPTTIPAVKDGTYAWGDMNNDGLLDLVVTGNDGAGLIAKIYKNCGSSCGYQFELLVDFGTTTEWFSPIEGSSLSLGDFNNDGLVDIATIGKRAINDYGHYGKVSILKNNGNGTFSVYFDGIPMCHRGSIQFADYDNMGDLEFAFNGVNDWGHVFGLRYYQTGSSYAIDYYQWLENFKDGMLAFADFDNDGKLDLLTSGDAYGTNDQQSKGPFTRMHKNNGIGGAYHALEAFAWVKNSKIAVCDYNNDGFADFFLSGETGDGSKMRLIYKNNGDFTFTVVDNDAVLGNGATAWGDYNNDGKADLAIIGKDASGSPYFNIYENNTANANTAPTAPTNLLTNVQTDKVDFTWTAGADANQTGGLTYILSVGTTAGGNDIVSEYALPKGTSIGQIVNTSWTLKKTLPNNAQYYWSVQAIDQSFARSTKATGSFVKGVTTGLKQKDIENVIISQKDNNIIVEGINVNDVVNVFSVNGMHVSKINAKSSTLSIQLAPHNIYVIQVNSQKGILTQKVVVR